MSLLVTDGFGYESADPSTTSGTVEVGSIEVADKITLNITSNQPAFSIDVNEDSVNIEVSDE